ncbi:MAG: glutathione S-transferase [Nitratireductor sp.]|jgi:glutathione S-transferase|nr:glutathione S-transferase [Nitratireductor sp.]
MKLWYSPTSPFVRKVIAVAHELGLTDRIEIVEAATSPMNRNESLAALNPVGKIPAMQLDDGQVLFDSRVIIAWLDSLAPGLIPSAGPDRFRAMTLEALGDAIMDAAVLTRYETAMRPEDLRWKGWIEAQMTKVWAALDSLEKDWLDFLNGPVTIGHMAVGAALGYLDFRYAESGWRDTRPGLARWYAEFARRPSMTASEPKG